MVPETYHRAAKPSCCNAHDSSSVPASFFFFKGYAPPRDLPSSPPRPSPDLSLIEHPAIGGDGVLDRRRKGVLRRQPVVDRKYTAAARVCDSCDQVAMRRYGAETKASAVKIKIGRAHV